MAVHHGKEGQVAIGGTAVGELTSFTLEATGDVVSVNVWICGNEVLRMAWDCSNGKVWLGGSQEFFNVGSGVGDPANGTNPSGTISTYAGAPIGVLHNRSTNTGRCIMNFGQNGDFSGTLTAQNNTDENGDGNFYYSVPAGFLALNTKNFFIDSTVPAFQTIWSM